MKKLIALLTALTLLVGCCALAFAESSEVCPTYSVNMETYGETDSTVYASIDPQRTGDDLCLVYGIYGTDLYAKEDILALKEGDTLLVNDESMTVKTVEATENGVEINGGFFNEDESGATLLYLQEDPEHLCSVMYDDLMSRTLVGEAAMAMADEVTVKTFRMGEDGDFHDEYDETAMPAAQVKDYLTTLQENGMSFTPDTCTVTLKDGKVTLITVDWAPNV